MMTMGIFLPVLVGFGALSVDISYINLARTQTQNVADAASHAAFVGYRSGGNDPDVGNAAAAFVVSENLIGNQVGHLDPVVYGEWDFDAKTFTPGGDVNSAKAYVSRSDANASPNQLDLFFAPILGFNKANVVAHGVAAGRTRQIMLISDVSGSFSGDIDKANDANVAFLDYMKDNPLPGDLLGHVVFAGTGNFPDLHELASPVDDYTSLLTEFQKLDVCTSMPSGIRAASYLVPEGKLRGVPPDRDCFTSQARGLHRAMQEFIEHGDSREFQGMILLTDGQANTSIRSSNNNNSTSTAEDDAENLVSWMWYGGTFNYSVWECTSWAATNKWHSSCGLQSYSGTFAGGVHLWTVYFGSNGSNVAWLESLVEIGDGNRGEAKDTDDASQLEAIYLEIAASIPVVLTD